MLCGLSRALQFARFFGVRFQQFILGVCEATRDSGCSHHVGSETGSLGLACNKLPRLKPPPPGSSRACTPCVSLACLPESQRTMKTTATCHCQEKANAAQGGNVLHRVHGSGLLLGLHVSSTSICPVLLQPSLCKSAEHRPATPPTLSTGPSVHTSCSLPDRSCYRRSTSLQLLSSRSTSRASSCAPRP